MSKTCFVICPLGNEGSEIRKRSNLLYGKVFKPICTKYNYTIDRADKIQIAGVITYKLLKYIRDSDLVIADLTDNNPNVYYELAIRHAIRKPVVCIMKEDQKIPFDIASIKVVKYSETDNEENLDKIKYELGGVIKEVINHPDDIDYPLSTIFHNSSLVANENPFKFIVDELQGGFNDAKKSMDDLKFDIISSISKGKYIEAEFLDGEDKAFNALTEATKRAKNSVRSTRFFPDSVLSQNAYVTAIHGRVTGLDGKTPLKKYLRIIALNNKNKENDVHHHLTSFYGRQFTIHLTDESNAFELVIIDDTDAFIHFYREERVINSTLHIMERTVVWEFKKIYDEFLKRTKQENIFECKHIGPENLGDSLKKASSIFSNKSMLSI